MIKKYTLAKKAAILKLPAGQKVLSSEVIQKMKERIVTSFEK